VQVDGRTRVVEFWRAVEMLSPQGIPKPEPPRRTTLDEWVIDFDEGEAGPWSAGHPLTAGPLPSNRARQYTVYGGLYEIDAVRQALVDEFGEDGTPADGRPWGQSALFAFTVDADGFLVENSGTLSSCAWALGRLDRMGRDASGWLDGFNGEAEGFASALDRLTPPDKPKPASGVATAARAVGRHTKDAAVDAVRAGAAATGTAVTAVAAAAAGAMAGPLVGGVAGAVAGTFVEKLLTPPIKTAADAPTAGDSRSRRPRPGFALTVAALHAFAGELAAALRVVQLLSPAGIRIQCRTVGAQEDDDATGQVMLNSFIADDLAQVGRAVARRDVGIGMQRYLTGRAATPPSVDVRRTPQAVVDGVEPARLPLGRWPGATAKALVLSQQFAVNQILAELGTGAGVFAVNGPPGTGKTTLLRDVVAAVVVGRARALADLATPANVFTDVVQRVKVADKYTFSVRGVIPAATGSEMIVATQSNTAAANVTKEIPGIAAVDGAEEEAAAADYFGELASTVLGAPAWGLLAATLGSRTNCAKFASRFWSGGRTDGRAVQGMNDLLRDDSRRADDWATAVSRFRAAEADAARLVAERQRAALALRNRVRLRTELDAADDLHLQLDQKEADLRRETTELRQACAAAAAEHERAAVAYREHHAHQPGFWVSLSTLLRAGREWEAERVRLHTERGSAQRDHRDRAAALEQKVGDHAALEARVRDAALRRSELDAALRDATAAVDAATSRWPGRVPDPVTDDLDAFQLCAPWADPELTEARNRVTLEALRLHKALVLGAGKPVLHNLRVAMAVLEDNLPVDTEALRAVWQTLFLVVPVVSTTFASLPRLFGRLGREDLGWLFIDEAGQATPQQAVGGLWRTRRAVVVGDPRQLEPIVNLPSTAQRVLLSRYGVADEWLPDGTSAQRVADQLTPYGTHLADPDGDGQTWVGAPLRVHRRCDRPMFEVSNRIAYGGTLMVYGTEPRPAFPGHNQWIAVPTTRSLGNWVPAEGEQLERLLRELADAGVEAADVRVISPFRAVVRGCRGVAGRMFGARFARENVGTVHTVQGREAEVVVLVLGSAAPNAGARRWVAKKPNLLNVAVSRARRRFYVIGDRSRWEDLRHFDVLAGALRPDVGTPQPQPWQ
jgi:hypothetical protein